MLEWRFKLAIILRFFTEITALWLLPNQGSDLQETNQFPDYHKIPKILDTRKFAVITLKVDQRGFTTE